MAEHHFTLAGQWSGGLQGEGKIACANLESTVSVPKEMTGPGKGTNPEELLLAAAATCYLITLGAILERRQIPVDKLTLNSQATVTQEGPSLKFTRIVHSPTLTLKVEATEAHREAALEATTRAEKACLISNSLRGKVEISVVPSVI
jgi:peroxiredoxin-like protein